MKAVKAKCEIWERKKMKTHLIQFQLFIFAKPACLQKHFRGRLLSISVFSPILIGLSWSRDAIVLIREETLSALIVHH